MTIYIARVCPETQKLSRDAIASFENPQLLFNSREILERWLQLSNSREILQRWLQLSINASCEICSSGKVVVISYFHKLSYYCNLILQY